MTTSEIPGTRDVRREVVATRGLTSVTRRPPFPEYVRRLWGRRFFILADARGRLVSGTRGTVLGRGWLILTPVLDGLIYYVIFGLLLHVVREGIDNFIGYLLIGVFLFHYTSRCLVQGSQSLLSGRNLVRAFSFPRAALPVAAVVREALNLVPVLTVMLVLLLAFPPGEVVTWRWLLFPLVIALQTVFNLGIALIAARATARLPDLKHVIGFFSRFWLYGSAVFFSFEQFVEDPTLLTVLQLNPLFRVLDISRDLLLYGVTPPLEAWAVLCAWAVVALGVGAVFFWRGEERYGTA
ncbi:ABC transporter permease [Cellulomonas sp. ATA003]|uniref:ABC transporter permease n=1 Tax=Cellulomonas sp. ATA003 TaxID=3073064 RepID=UPI0028737920|nr:ABC transporter permease [Cellulomonas sp. ATA003]WNB85188.1 ABC transporter permease [Cellulomonas sp. ATA003]